MRTSRIIFYDEPSVPEIDLDGAAEFVENTLKIRPEKRDSVFSRCNDSVVREIAASRIQKLSEPFQRHEPSAEELEFERKTSLHENSNITYYDGFELQSALCRAVPREELADDVFHIIFTGKMTCTYDPTDRRYHGRALIGSNPSIISTTGIIEAPAKPREYYTMLMAYSKMGINTSALKEKFRGSFLEYHDSRLGSVVKGYILQALLYYETHEAFCDSVDCMLHNAHWQKDLLHSQLEVGVLCQRHQDILNRLTAS